MKKIIFILILSCITCAGCGYTTRPTVIPGVTKIYIETFKNNIYEPNLETDLNSAITDVFIKDGYYRIVKREEADAVLSGEIINYEKSALRYDLDENIQEYRLAISVNMRLVNTQNESVIFDEKGFTGDTTYFLTGASAKSERTARADAVNDLAKRIVNRTIEGW